MGMIDRRLPDRGLKKYYEKEMKEFDPVTSLCSETEYQWCVLGNWHSSCDFETKEELDFIMSLGFSWQDFGPELLDDDYEKVEEFYEALLA